MGCSSSSAKVVAVDAPKAPVNKKDVAETKPVSQPVEDTKVPKLDLNSAPQNANGQKHSRPNSGNKSSVEPLPDIPMKTGRTNKVVAFEIADRDKAALRAPPRRLQQLQVLPKLTMEQLSEKQRQADEKRTRALESKRLKSARTSRRRKNLRAALQLASETNDGDQDDCAADDTLPPASDGDQLNVSLVRTDLAGMQLAKSQLGDSDQHDDDEQVYKRSRQNEKQTSPRDAGYTKLDRKSSADSRRSAESGIASAAHSASSWRKPPSTDYRTGLDENIKLNLQE